MRNSRQQALIWLGVQTPGASRCPKPGGPGSSEEMAHELTTVLLYKGKTLSSSSRPGHEATGSWGLQKGDFWGRGYAVGWRVPLLSVHSLPLRPGFLLAQHLRVAWAVSHWAAGGHTGGRVAILRECPGLFLPSRCGSQQLPPSQAQASPGPTPWEAVATLRQGHPKQGMGVASVFFPEFPSALVCSAGL